MDTDLIKTFLEVSKTCHFGKAAESLYLTQSAISFRIKQLETLLGVELFARNHNKIQLTAEGEKLIPYAKHLMSIWQTIKEEISEKNRIDTISIGSTPLLWETLLTPWLKNFYNKNNLYLHIDTQISQRAHLINLLCDRKIDLVISTEKSKQDDFICTTLFSIQLSQYHHTNCLIDSDSPYLHLEWSDYSSQFYKELDRKTKSKNIFSTNSAHLAKELLESTKSFTFFPSHWAKQFNDLTSNKDTPIINCPVYAIYLKNNTIFDKFYPYIRSLFDVNIMNYLETK